MNIIFEDKALEELYTDGSTKSHQYYKLSKDVIKQYIKVVNFLKAARRVEDLFYIKSLHYEKKKGDLNGVDAVWINKQYRLLFNSSANEEGIVVNALLFEISKLISTSLANSSLFEFTFEIRFFASALLFESVINLLNASIRCSSGNCGFDLFTSSLILSSFKLIFAV